MSREKLPIGEFSMDILEDIAPLIEEHVGVKGFVMDCAELREGILSEIEKGVTRAARCSRALEDGEHDFVWDI